MVLARMPMTAGRESRRHTQQDTTSCCPLPRGLLAFDLRARRKLSIQELTLL